MIAWVVMLMATTGTNGALTLPMAVDGALERSKDLESALLTLESASLAPHRLDAAYQWNAFAEGGVSRDEAPRRSPFEPETITTVPLAAGLSRLFPTGTFVEVRADGAWFETPAPSVSFGGPAVEIPSIESGWSQGVTITARHPVYGKSPDEVLALQKTQVAAEVEAGGSRIAEGLDQVLGDVHRRFWGQALSQEALRVSDEGVKAAKEIHDLVARKRKRGFADDRDSLRAQAAVQQAKEQLLAAERALDQSRRGLLDRVGVQEGAYARVEYDLKRAVREEPLESLVARAEASSLALRSLNHSRRAREVEITLARTQQQSSLYAIGRLSEQGLFPNGSFDDDFGFVAFGGLRWDKAFGDSDAKTRIRQADLDLKRLDADIARTKERIRVAAAEANAAIASARERIKNAEDLVATQEKRYAEEQKNFDIGRSLLRDVIEARQSLTGARFGLAAARVSLQMAATERDLLAGGLTESWRERLASRNPAYRAVSNGEKK